MKPVTPHSARTRQLMAAFRDGDGPAAPTREDVVQLSLRIAELRRARDEVAKHLKAAEAQLDAALRSQIRYTAISDAQEAVDAERSPTLRRADALTRQLLRALQATPEATVAYLMDQTDSNNKRVHNALRTLERRGLAKKVGRGRWKVLPVCDCNPSPAHPHRNSCPVAEAGRIADAEALGRAMGGRD